MKSALERMHFIALRFPFMSDVPSHISPAVDARSDANENIIGERKKKKEKKLFS